MKKKKKLTAKQRRFVEEYLIDLNATQAAIRAGYSQKTAKQIATENLSKPVLQEAIDQKQLEITRNNNIRQEEVVKEYARLAFFNPKSLFDENNQPIPINELPEDVAAALGNVDITMTTGKDGTPSYVVKMKAEKKPSLDSLARHLGMFKERIEVDGKIELSWEDPDVLDVTPEEIPALEVGQSETQDRT